MRYIGNKENLVEKIYFLLQEKNISGETFFDFCSGTASVGKFFKKKGYRVVSSDLLYFSYCLQRSYLVNNAEPNFEQLFTKYNFPSQTLFASPLGLVLQFLDSLEGVEGFIYKNYTPTGTEHLEQPRMFFIDQNGKKIDAIRQQIENWREEELLTDDEYFILITSLIESLSFHSNISGVYAAFQKIWDPRALKPLRLREIEIIKGDKENVALNKNSLDIVQDIECDILYLDPPYNHRQYAPNYHLLETIAKYDNPEIKGVVGMRNYQEQKSVFCNGQAGLKALEKIAENGRFKYLVLSYNSEGAMPQTEIQKVLGNYGKLELIEFDYLRFKSNSNGDTKNKKFIKEQLYVLTSPKIL